MLLVVLIAWKIRSILNDNDNDNDNFINEHNKRVYK